MGDWHQDIVVKNISDHELDRVIDDVLDYLMRKKIISQKRADNVLGDGLGYCPGERWFDAVRHPEEKGFLDLLTNGFRVQRGRTVFCAGGEEFEKIGCPTCGENNLGCDWGKLFGKWVEAPNSAQLVCKSCEKSSSISEYTFTPKWALSNLGFIFWNWPMFSNSFISKLEKLTGKKIELVQGKL